MFDPSIQYDELYPNAVLGPSGVGHLELISAIAGGERHNVALDESGTVWTWGWNYFGQLGMGTQCSGMNEVDCMSTMPVKIPDFNSVKAVASRGYHTLALKFDGTVWSWGFNAWGQLGDGSNQDRHSPVQVLGLDGHGGVSAISGGGEISVALMADHSLMAWGRNNHGAIGNGVFDPNDIGQWSPVSISQASGLTDVEAVATGWAHVVALDADGTVWTWGANGSGQLGDGTTNDRNVPYHVHRLSDVIGVSAGDGHSVALEADGTVWAWGWNLKGQCGDGTRRNNRTIPVRVVFFPSSIFLPILLR